MVEEVREQVIRASAYRPYEGGKRVFVIEAAEAMRDESQNAMLKTLEEPPEFVHLILLTAEPEALLETIASRCQAVDFAPLPHEAVEAVLREEAPAGVVAEEVAAAARLAAGDLELARLLLDEQGRKLREQAVARDWSAMLKSAERAGEEAESTAREALEEEKEAGMKRSARDIADASKRAGRRRRTDLLDLGLNLVAAWFRDLAAVASGAADVVYNRDRLTELQFQATGLDPSSARRAAELIQDTRRRLDLNVSEELALEALSFRLAVVLD
jgi:DNA polymerase-3 subunit delta'